MRSAVILIVISLACFACNRPHLDGLYLGYEEMCYVDSTGKKECYGDPANKAQKWFHKSYLKIRSDSAFMDQDPIAVSKQDTAYSASDGAFYYYKGTVTEQGDSIIIKFNNKICDYCGRPVKTGPNGELIYIKEERIIKGKKDGDGLVLEGVLYKRTGLQKKLWSETRSFDPND